MKKLCKGLNRNYIRDTASFEVVFEDSIKYTTKEQLVLSHCKNSEEMSAIHYVKIHFDGTLIDFKKRGD